jgi:hypothetical protein
MARAMVNALTTFLPFLCLTFISVTTHYRNLSTEARGLSSGEQYPGIRIACPARDAQNLVHLLDGLG